MIVFEHVQKCYREQAVLKDINLEIKSGEIFVLLGASGCGKTTCLKMINRLEDATAGRILFKGEDIRDKELIPYRRNIGYVLQNMGLFPHMTVRQNLSLLQEIEHIPKEKIEKTNRELMEMIGLEPDLFFDRFPYQLSGGQKQRIGVARVFALDPEVVLMDEPFSAVDPLVRVSLQDELLKIQRKMKKTIVFVTHDIGEAFRIGDRICLFHDSSIEQCAEPDVFRNNPSSAYVKNFISQAECRIDKMQKKEGGGKMTLADFLADRGSQIFSLFLQHVELTVISVCMAVVIGIPIGILLSSYQSIRKPVLTVINACQAVPSLAFLGLLIPVIGIGAQTAVVLVVIYALLPIIKNTCTGLMNLDEDIILTARGIGLTDFQILTKIQFPLALPVIMAGVRIAAVSSVGLVTIAAYVGGRGLGFLVYSGINMVDSYMIWGGAVPAAVFALFIDFILARLERAVTPHTAQAGKRQ